MTDSKHRIVAMFLTDLAYVAHAAKPDSAISLTAVAMALGERTPEQIGL